MKNSAAILETQLVTVSVIFHCHDQIPNKEQFKEEIIWSHDMRGQPIMAGNTNCRNGSQLWRLWLTHTSLQDKS